MNLQFSPNTRSSIDESNAAADAMYALAFEMTESNRWSDASDVFRAMLLLCPTDERGWLGLARCHVELGQPDVATELYSLCMVAVPRAVRARIALARLLRSASRDEDADGLLSSAAEIAESLDDEALIQLVENSKRMS